MSNGAWEFLKDNAVAIGAAAAVLGIIGTLAAWGRTIARAVGAVLRRLFRIFWPGGMNRARTISIVEHPQQSWWHMGSVSGQPAMQVVSNWYVTNLTNRGVRVLSARITKPPVLGTVATRRHGDDVFGTVSIPPHATGEVTADFWVKPPTRRVAEEFRATVVLVDQFGNEHKVRNVVFHYR